MKLEDYAQFGIAATLPGLQRAVDLLQAQISELQAQLINLQAPAKRRGRPRRDELPQPITEQPTRREDVPRNPATGWPLDRVERKREMDRRYAARRRNAAKKAKEAAPQLTEAPTRKLHPANPEHPGHKKWLAKLRKNGRARWENMTAAERTAHLEKMQAGRYGKNGKAEARA